MIWFKSHTADAKFNKFDNSLGLIDKIKEGEIRNRNRAENINFYTNASEIINSSCTCKDR